MGRVKAKQLGRKTLRKRCKRTPEKGGKRLRQGRRGSAAISMKSSAMRKTPYVRFENPKVMPGSKRRCEVWCTSLPRILAADGRGVEEERLEQDIVRDWGGLTCPFCSSGKLGASSGLKGGRQSAFLLNRMFCNKEK